jgi:hypothetical protein
LAPISFNFSDRDLRDQRLDSIAGFQHSLTQIRNQYCDVRVQALRALANSTESAIMTARDDEDFRLGAEHIRSLFCHLKSLLVYDSEMGHSRLAITVLANILSSKNQEGNHTESAKDAFKTVRIMNGRRELLYKMSLTTSAETLRQCARALIAYYELAELAEFAELAEPATSAEQGWESLYDPTYVPTLGLSFGSDSDSDSDSDPGPATISETELIEKALSNLSNPAYKNIEPYFSGFKTRVARLW